MATDAYGDAPKKLDNAYPEGTKAPIQHGRFHFTGKTLESCADWLRDAPDDVALNREYFTAMDQFSRADDTVLLCRAVRGQQPTKLVIECFPEKTDNAVIQMSVSLGIRFDEALRRYQIRRTVDGKPDRSKGQPYSKDAAL